MFIIRKNTYSIKEDLKKVGCKWNTKYKCWIFPNEKATKGFKFEIVESLDKLDIPKEKPYKKFTASCINMTGVIIRQVHLRGKEIDEFTVKGMGEHIGKWFIFSNSNLRYTQGEILENVPCKILKSYGETIFIDKILDI